MAKLNELIRIQDYMGRVARMNQSLPPKAQALIITIKFLIVKYLLIRFFTVVPNG